MAEHGWLGPIEWAAKARARPGENICGDRLIAVDVNQAGALLGVLDGLGHGADAAEASQRGVEVLRAARAEPLDVLVKRCHHALSGTRGVAMTLAHLDFQAGTLSWIGVGNVTADLVAKHPAGVEVRSSARLIGGIVGYRIPETLTPQHVSVRPGDLLVIASDGIVDGHLDDIDFAASPLAIVDHILHNYAKENDDALVLAARHRGASATGAYDRADDDAEHSDEEERRL
ncbi:SpoIIE family protein phosphatase [Candidatus Mycobacterium methanotrophicum]|uniref:Serine/threonine-protein phosphatase n=1 Tax=Candidatus Mycobacterium methanotrophicum TaxID=2943498 RepID=A0ABY4QJF6_9MYCO|nr:SpoIIE family protein phosphatase [Candidatus Mycobacterium methanotrophicum]UQX11150.1 serine/threonine-protein phosphatase [Candidatus Mycobacterium methanotrophicum]